MSFLLYFCVELQVDYVTFLYGKNYVDIESRSEIYIHLFVDIKYFLITYFFNLLFNNFFCLLFN